MSRVVIALAALCCLTAWGMTIYQWVSNLPPAREVIFLSPDGQQLEADNMYCHRSVLVDDRRIYQVCQLHVETGRLEISYLVRFDLASGTGQALALPDEMSGETFFAFLAAARHPIEGWVTLVAGRWGSLLWVHDDDTVTVIGQFPRAHGLGVVNGGLEVVTDDARIHRLNTDGTWTERQIASPRALENARWLPDARPDGWEFLSFEPWVDEPGTGPDAQQVRPLYHMTESSQPEPMPGLQIRLEGAYSKVSESFVGGAAGFMPDYSTGLAPLERTGDSWQPVQWPAWLEVPHDVTFDYELGESGLTPILAVGLQGIRLDGRWYRFHWSPQSTIEREDGIVSPPVVHKFWMQATTKLFDDGDGGFWMMGSVGRAYLHLDQTLTRTDSLTAGERVARLFVQDRENRRLQQRKLGVYDDAPLQERAAVPIVLLLFPLGISVCVLLGTVTRWRQRVSKAFTVFSVVYLLFAGALGYMFYTVIRFI